MKEYIKHTPGNDFDAFVEGANQNFGYLNKSIDFPSYDKAMSGQGIEAEWFYNVYGGTEAFSELNAIRLYTSDSAKFDSVATLFFGVALVEMLHRDKLGDFILSLGGNIDGIEYNNSELKSETEGSTDVKSALAISIESEKDTISEYGRIMELCKAAQDSPTKEIALQLLNKLIADENVHLKYFQEKLDNLSTTIGFGF